MLLDDTEIKEHFASLRHIANFLEHERLDKSGVSLSQSTLSSAAHLHTLLSLSAGSDGTPKHANRAELDMGHLEFPSKINSSDVGSLLRIISDQLEKRIDACFVEFYEHMKNKKKYRSKVTVTRRQDESDRLQPIVSAGGNAYFMKKGRNRGLEEIVGGEPILDGSGSPLKTFLHGGWSRRDAPILKKIPKGSSACSRKTSLCSSLPSTTRSEKRRNIWSSQSPHEAASIIQNHLYLLLESALSQMSASCGGIYLSDTSEASTAAHPEDAPKFLIRVADISGQNKLPQSVSYATLNTLTTVVQTGVALNLSRSKAEPIAQHLSDRSTSCGEGAPYGAVNSVAKSAGRVPVQKSTQKIFGRFLHVKTAVVMPIDNIGCVIIVDKHGTDVNDIRFTRTDEFVAWSVARLCKQIFIRYKTDLFLHYAWAPSAVTCLRHFTLLPSLGGNPKDCHLPKKTTSGRWRLLSRVFTECNKHFEVEKVLKPVAIVRADVDTVQKLDSNIVEKLCDNFPEGSSDMNEEEIFTSAAEYITKIETLWARTIEENVRLKSDFEKIFQELEEQKQILSTMMQKKQRSNYEKSLLTSL
ncbi:unnamed protein product [Phytomonas sp. EM1]|nr:unnamed protein product [Phytomonas sp. EM1]|eukprot:CCW62044.1 unnamed protein product [Phytomonas sp. isolate EM1]